MSSIYRKDLWARNKRLTIDVLTGMSCAKAGAQEGLCGTRISQMVERVLTVADKRVRYRHGSDIGFMYLKNHDKKGWWGGLDVRKARRYKHHLVPLVYNLSLPNWYNPISHKGGKVRC